MTLEAWVKPTAPDWRTVIIKEQSGGLAYALYASDDSGRPSAASTARPTSARPARSRIPGRTSPRPTTAARCGSTSTASRSEPRATGAIRSPAGALRIGGNAIWGEYFAGLIDEVRVYNRALTAAEIRTDMNAPIVPTDTPPRPRRAA